MHNVNPEPLVSIVIPVYNGSDYLKEAIDSALAQTYKHLEVIVVNDGSTDEGETEKIARSYGNRIRYIYKKNGGVASALNLGINTMKGRYFSWLSHDDAYYPNKIEEQVKYLIGKTEGTVLYCDLDVIDEHSRVTGTVRLSSGLSGNMIMLLLSQSHINFCTLLVPRECFDMVGLFDETLTNVQDYQMLFRLARQFPFEHQPEVLFRSRHHSQQGQRVRAVLHQQEKESFLAGLLNELSAGELHMDSGIPSPWGYLLVFLYLLTRRLPKTAQVALEKFNSGYTEIPDIGELERGIDSLVTQEPHFDVLRAQVYFHLGEMKAGIGAVIGNDCFKKGLEILMAKQQKSGHDIYLISSTYKRLGEFTKAAEWFRQVTGNSRETNLRSAAFFHLGEICYKESRAGEAKEMFTRCLEICPEHKKARQYLESLGA